MPRVHEIHKFPLLIDDFLKSKKSKRSAVGARIINQRLKKIGELAPNNQPIEMSRLLLIKKGETVPKAFRGIAGLKVNVNGIANESYTDGWCQSHWNQSGDWDNTWGECWDNSTALSRIAQSILVLNSATQRVKTFSLDEFSSKELEAISKLGVIS